MILHIVKPSKKWEDVNPFVEEIRGSDGSITTNKNDISDKRPSLSSHLRQTIQKKRKHVLIHMNKYWEKEMIYQIFLQKWSWNDHGVSDWAQQYWGGIIKWRLHSGLGGRA